MFQRWENDTRYYLIHVQVDLFGATTLRRVWGGLGTARGSQKLDPKRRPGAWPSWQAGAGAAVIDRCSDGGSHADVQRHHYRGHHHSTG